MSQAKKGVKMIPPDGGWGWFAVIGVSIVNMATRSIEPSFGLLFGDLLEGLGVATTGAAVIMSTMDAMINLSGFFVGPLCKYLSFRKVSLIGSALNAVGLILTFPAVSMAHIIITYSIIGGIGTGLASSATFVALNHYFYHKRGQAVGLSLAGTAIGMMLFPQGVRLLLEEYDFRGAVLILGGINLNSLVGSCLLQPAEWHFKPAPEESKDAKNHIVEMETITENDNEDDHHEAKDEDIFEFSAPSLRPEVQILLTPPPKIAVITTRKTSFSELPNATVKKNASATALNNLIPSKKVSAVPRNFSALSLASMGLRKRKNSVISMSSMDFTGSSVQLHLTEPVKESKDEFTNVVHFRRTLSTTSADKALERHERGQSPIQIKIEEKKMNIWTKFYQFLDLDLLKDGIYLNLLLGLSLFYVAEQNFKMVTPFFFLSMGYSRADVAFCLSFTAIMDIVARLILPPICDRLAPDILRRKTIFMISSLFLAFGRSFLAMQTEWIPLLTWFTICGFLRGAVLINFTLTVSEWCPSLEKLPAAFGLQMVAKGIFVILFGPLLGLLRDETKSYPLLLHVQNVLILLCVLVWTIEYIYVFCFKSKRDKVSAT